MPRSNFLNRNKYQLVFILFVVFYMFYYSFHGYDDADGGYTLALSWRIFNGEIPYRDIVLVRPPFSPLFHTLPLFVIPDNYQIIFDRLLCYVLFASSALLGSLSIDKVVNLQQYKVNSFLLATLGFVYSVGNFPAMAWHTVDGIFFASIGVYILASWSSIYAMILAMLFLFLSALCKQPFYLLPFMGIFYIKIVHRDWTKLLAAVLTLAILVTVFFTILYIQNALTNFISFTGGSSKLKDLFSAGVQNYLNVKSIYLLIPFALWLMMKRLSIFKHNLLQEKVVPYFFITILLVFPLLKFAYSILFEVVSYKAFFNNDTAKYLFILTIVLFILNWSNDKKWLTLLFLTSISWCASISWGYQTPILFSTPLLFGFLFVSNKYFGIKKVTNLALYSLVLGAITYYVAYQKPYCNPKRHLLTYKIDHLFPKMQHIYVGKETHDKYVEFASLVRKYGNNFKTLPGMPLSNYLTNTNSLTSIDWVFNAETSNKNQSIINELRSKKAVVFLEKNPQLIAVTKSNEKFNSSVSYFIKTNWLKIGNTKYFEIYRP